MARTNYSYEKRQRDLAKKKKKEEKRNRKLGITDAPSAEGAATASLPTAPVPDAPVAEKTDV